MTQPINLNRFRKSKAKKIKEKIAAENRIKHGMTKAQKQKLKAEKDKAAKNIDGHKLGDDYNLDNDHNLDNDK